MDRRRFNILTRIGDQKCHYSHLASALKIVKKNTETKEKFFKILFYLQFNRNRLCI